MIKTTTSRTLLGLATTVLAACSGAVESVGSLPLTEGSGGSSSATAGGETSTAPAPAACAPYVRLVPGDSEYGPAGDRPFDYTMGIVTPGVASIKSSAAATPGFGTWMAATPSTSFAGHRVRLRASVVSKNVATPSWAGVWLRADDAAGEPVAFDNMEDRPIVGSDVSTREVVLDVPAAAKELAFGTLLSGSGEVEIANMSIATADEPHFIADARDWFPAGDAPTSYTMEVNAAATHCGRPGAHIASKSGAAAEGFGTFMDMVDARAYRGKRIRLTGAVRTSNVTGTAGIWLRVDTATQQVLDNMSNRPITGTTPTTQHSAVLDVPADATQIGFGALVVGAGELWLDKATLEVVDTTVPTTGTHTGPIGGP